MSLLRKIRHGLRVLTNRAAADRDLDEEVGHFFDEFAVSFEAQGLSPAEARRAASLENGGALAVREEVRDAGWENCASGVIDNGRYAIRRMRRSPGFTGVAIVTH